MRRNPSITFFLPLYLSLSFIVLGMPASTVTSATEPSFLRMFARLSFIRECGISTAGSNARPALRMRVNMSEIGSVINLPAGFHYAGNQTVQRGLPEGHA